MYWTVSRQSIVRQVIALCVFMAAILIIGPGQLLAQPRVVLQQMGPPADLLQSIDLATGRVEWMLPTVVGQFVVTADGRYLVGAQEANPTHPHRLWVRDLSTSQLTTFQFGSGSLPFGLIAHPQRTEVFGTTTTQAVSITFAGVRELASCPALPLQFPSLALSGNGRRLVLKCGARALRLIDTDTGVVTESALDRDLSLRIALDWEGQRLYGIADEALTAFDAESGIRIPLAQTPSLPAGTVPTLFGTSPDRQYLFVQSQVAGAYVAQMTDAETFVVRQHLPISPVRAAFQAEVTPDGRWAAVASIGQTTPRDTAAELIDLQTNTVVAGGFVGSYNLYLRLAASPEAPLNLDSAVDASSVGLSWQTAEVSAAISHFRLEAGSVSGAANLATFIVPASERGLTIPGVPSGTYFVRVRAVNHTGSSGPSNEIIVTVP